MAKHHFAGIHQKRAGLLSVALCSLLLTVTGCNPDKDDGKVINNTRPIYQFDSSVFPVDAVQYIKENPQKGNMFNEFNWGGYLQNNLWPKYNVFLDSQSDFYGEDLMRDYDQIISANDSWESLLQKYQVDWLIIPVNTPLAGQILNAANWEIIYRDNTSMIGIRK